MTKEETLRKPGWEPGPGYAPIVLGDGQEWHFPRPRLTLKATVHPETKRLEFTSDIAGLAIPYSEFLDRISAQEQDAPRLVVELCLELLRQNYTIPDELVPDLFYFDPDNAADQARLTALWGLCLGRNRAPKD